VDLKSQKINHLGLIYFGQILRELSSCSVVHPTRATIIHLPVQSIFFKYQGRQARWLSSSHQCSVILKEKKGKQQWYFSKELTKWKFIWRLKKSPKINMICEGRRKTKAYIVIYSIWIGANYLWPHGVNWSSQCVKFFLCSVL
jgi:hypothetical protein